LNIRDFWDSYFDFYEVQGFLDDVLGLPTTGNKPELIERIVTNERFHPNLIYEWLRAEDVKELCGALRLHVTGSKRTLWNRVLEAVNEFDGEFGGLNESPETPKKEETESVETIQEVYEAKNDEDALERVWSWFKTPWGILFSVVIFLGALATIFAP